MVPELKEELWIAVSCYVNKAQGFEEYQDITVFIPPVGVTQLNELLQNRDEFILECNYFNHPIFIPSSQIKECNNILIPTIEEPNGDN